MLRIVHCRKGLDDLIHAQFKLGERDCLLHVGRSARIVAHCVVVLDTAPLRVHYDSGAVETAVQAGRDEACDMTHGRLSSMDEQRNELLLLRGLDREDVDQGKKLVAFRDRGHGQLSGGNGWWTIGGSEEPG